MTEPLVGNEAFLLVCFVAWLVAAVLIKFATLISVRWGSTGRCLLAAVLMNLASSLLSPLHSEADQFNPWIWGAVSAAQVLIELVVLFLLNRNKRRTAVVATILSNSVALGLLVVLMNAVPSG